MLKIALIQMKVVQSKTRNLEKAAALIKEAASQNAKIVVLPECFNCPYGTEHFKDYAEEKHEETYKFLQTESIAYDILLIGGSIPELDSNKIFNTTYIFENGKFLNKHRKVHLFDIDIPGKIRFTESDVLSAGDQITVVNSSYGKVGVGICFDLRFPEMQMAAARKGAFLLCYPGAFNQVTGPLHWDLLFRSRAVDNQVFMAGCAPALDKKAGYQSHGHSLIVDPLGEILSQANYDEQIVYANIDKALIESTRSSIPVYKKRRFDVYAEIK